MSSADLDYIRALLVAQTAEPEPQAKSLLGRLFAAKPEPPRPPSAPPRFAIILDLAAPAQTDGRADPRPDVGVDVDTGVDFSQELLLDQICGPTAAVESASPLPPPRPRAEFGRRPDLAPEPELVLDQPAAAARRLQLLDPSGQPVGEMILRPDEPPMRDTATVVREEVPYFPEDFLDHGHPTEPQPLRPWLKALRKSGRVQPDRSVVGPVAEPDDGAPLTKRVRERRAKGRQPPPKAAAQSLGHDLLEALALTLAREQENLADRLLSVADGSMFRQAMAESAAA